MKSKEYIKSQLNELRNVFTELSFRYQFNENTSTHIIEVKPLECYEENLDYIKCEANLIYEFENQFSPESILFVSEDSLTQVTNPEFTFDMKTFSLVVSFVNYNYSSEQVEDVFSGNEDNYALAA